MISKYNCTLENLMDRNKIFFSKETVSFHKDQKYSLVQEGKKRYLRVVHEKGIAYYEIGDDLRLNYTRLMENIL